MKTVCQVGY